MSQTDGFKKGNTLQLQKKYLGNIMEETEASMECDDGAEVMMSLVPNTCTDR